MAETKVVIFAQVAGGALYPLGEATVDENDRQGTAVAALFRSLSSELDPDAAFLEQWMRYDEDGEPS